MRKITKQAVKAFINHSNFNSSNTEVLAYAQGRFGVDSVEMYLHGNLIAEIATLKNMRCVRLKLNFCGWPTPTTKERLNGLTYELFGEKLFYTERGILKMSYSVNNVRIEVNPDKDLTFENKNGFWVFKPE